MKLQLLAYLPLLVTLSSALPTGLGSNDVVELGTRGNGVTGNQHPYYSRGADGPGDDGPGASASGGGVEGGEGVAGDGGVDVPPGSPPGDGIN